MSLPHVTRSGVPPVLSAESIQTIIATVSCITAVYDAFELNFLVWSTFKSRSGLYFWSFLTATNGIMPYSIGYLLLYYSSNPSPYLIVTLTTVGSMCMLCGQSVVLYSRLHLVNHEPKVLRLVLAFIIFTGILTQIPIAVFQYATSIRPPNPDTWFDVFLIWRKLEVTLFCLEETVLSGLYIIAAIQFFQLKRTLTDHTGQAKHNLALPLLITNLIVILLDFSLLAVTYASLSTLQPGYRAFVVSYFLLTSYKFI